MTVAVLGLGGNLGDRRGQIAAALDRLARHPQISVERVSALYETPPWGKTDQPAFLNAAVGIETGGKIKRKDESVVFAPLPIDLLARGTDRVLKGWPRPQTQKTIKNNKSSGRMP